jgi:hypothetical protein
MWLHEAAIEAVVRDEFRKSFSRSPENEVVQFDDWERRRDRAIGRDLYGHFAFDCQVREIPEIQNVTMAPYLTLKKATSDRPFYPELLHGARPRATNLVADQTVAGRYPKRRDGILELISSSEGQVEIRIRETCPGLTRAVVAPLASSQFL